MAGLIKKLQQAFPKEATEIAESALDGPKSYGVPVLLYLKELERSHGEKFKTDTVKNAVNQLCEHYHIASFETVTSEKIKIVEKVDALRIEIARPNSKSDAEINVWLYSQQSKSASRITQDKFDLNECTKQYQFIQQLREKIEKKEIYESLSEQFLIEFAVDSEYLVFPFHQWQATEKKDAFILGNSYRVTVRLRRRKFDGSCGGCWEKQAKLNQKTCLVKTFEWVDDLSADNLSDQEIRLKVSDGYGIGFKKSLETLSDLSDTLEDYNVAVALWSHTMNNEVQKQVCSFLKGKKFHELPQLIHKLRKELYQKATFSYVLEKFGKKKPNLCRDITLFWDEPERINFDPNSQKPTESKEKDFFHALS